MQATDADAESKQFMKDCLGTSLILQKILKHFSSTELLRLSLVNKLWNYEARCVLRDKYNLSVKMKPGRSFCQNLRALASKSRKMNVIPFTGINIVQGHACFASDHKGGWNKCLNMDPIYEDILERLLWKSLAVRLLDNWDKHKRCTGLLFVKQILDNYCQDLEELSIVIVSNHLDFVQDFLQGCSFPRLKTLKFLNTPSYTRDYASLIKTLVTRAPNLQVLHTTGSENLHLNLLEGSSAVLGVDFGFAPYLDEIPDNITSRLRLTRLKALSRRQDFGLERLNSTMLTTLKMSRATLSSIHIDLIFLVALMQYGILLENVRDLKILVVSDHLEPLQSRILRLVKDFDITKMFPRLTQVTSFPYYRPAFFSVEEMNEVIELSNVNSNKSFTPATDRPVSPIKTLSLSAYYADITDFQLKLLSEMLPNIEKILVGSCQVVPYSLLWRPYWTTLRELTVKTFGTRPPRNHFNYDSLFCGIFPEEVAELQARDEKYLRSVNIVPVMPSITCLKGLRSFKFLYMETGFTGGTNDQTFLFSKVTGLVAFRRCPDLTVTLEMDGKRLERALSHMKPYAHVTRHGRPMSHFTLYY